MTVSIQPVVNWPREVTVGQAYLVTADIVLAESSGWPYEREEFVVGCVLEGGNTFSIESLGSTGLVLHRFGGTYGPVEFVVRPLRDPAPGGFDDLRLTFLTEGGLPFRTVPLVVRPGRADSPASPSTVVEVAAPLPWRAGAESPAAPPLPVAASRPAAPTHHHPAEARAARRTALLIGVAHSGSHAVESDLRAVESALAVHGFETRSLLDSDATRDAISRVCEDLIASAEPDDAVFVYVNLPVLLGQQAGGAYLYLTKPDQGAGEVLTPAELTTWHGRLAAVTPNVTMAFESHAFDEDAGTSVPDVVQLFASGPGQPVHDVLIDGVRRSIFTDALAQTLHEVGDRPVTWAVVMDRVRRRVLDRVPLQRPTLLGPARRVVFRLAEAEPEVSLPVTTTPDGMLLLDGAPLLGVQIGDEYAIMPPGADGPNDELLLCTAEVVALTPVAAVAEPRPPRRGTVPLHSRAFRTRAVAVATPIRVPAHDGLLEAMAASPLVRPSTAGDHHLVEVRADDAGLLSIHDEIGPVQDPRRSDDNGLRLIVTDLERLARAHALRTLTEDPKWAFDPPIEIEWGRLADGQPHSLPASGTTVHAGDRIYFRIRNTGSETVYLSLIDIGVAAEVTLLNHGDPSSAALPPGREFVLGRDRDGDLHGLPLRWPQRLDPTRARPETVLVLITSAPQEMRMLEQQGIRSAARRPSSTLERTLTQLTTGAARSMAGANDLAVQYAVRPITFFLDPTPRADTAVRVSEMAENAGNLLPVYMVADESFSMSDYVNNLNDGLAQLHDVLLGEPMAAAKVRFTILGFSDDVQLRLAMADLRRENQLPKLVARNLTEYGKVFEDLRVRIPADVASLKGQGYTVHRPAVFFFSDGQPTDGNGWRNIRDQLVDPRQTRTAPNIIACGIGDVRPQTMLDVATKQEYAFVSTGTDLGAEIAKFCAALTRSILMSGRTIGSAHPELVVARPQNFKMAIDVI
ncbi:hypothetical protein AB0869_15490 [Micromonospora vinacea]|uniref:hypothetical protein n=1 Tax=Micromonospora vinacea TaxID=709878 RepID=UPI003452D04C